MKGQVDIDFAAAERDGQRESNAGPAYAFRPAALQDRDVRARFREIGCSCKSLGIAGNDVEMTVESRFSMNRAQATVSVVTR